MLTTFTVTYIALLFADTGVMTISKDEFDGACTRSKQLLKMTPGGRLNRLLRNDNKKINAQVIIFSFLNTQQSTNLTWYKVHLKIKLPRLKKPSNVDFSKMHERILRLCINKSSKKRMTKLTTINN